MPIYEYKCNSCGKKFEKIEKFSDLPMETHVEGCGGPVERLISAPAFQFKGTGWYVTDYAKSSGSGDGGKHGSESKGSESKGESGSESKSERSSESKSDSKSSSDSSSSSSKGGDSGSSSSSNSSTPASTAEKK